MSSEYQQDLAGPRRHFAMVVLTGIAAASLSTPALAQNRDIPHVNQYGMTGVIDMPTALSQPDGELTFTSSYFGGINRNTLAFQILPRVQGSFRYTGFHDLNYPNGRFEDYYDRSFDISIQLLRERQLVPALAVGFQDFIGTGIFSSEYVVATKSFGDDRFQLSAGLGWGRLGSYESIGTPFGERPRREIDLGGEAEFDQLFQGPAAPFASVVWNATDRLALMAEYSSDAYELETGSPRSDEIFSRDSPFNFGAQYRINDNVTLGGSYMYGSEFGVQLTFRANPYSPPITGSVAAAPQPVYPRQPRAVAPETWREDWVGEAADETLLGSLNDALDGVGITATSLEIVSPVRVRVQIRNARYQAEAMAIGRTARALTRTMPSSVEFFEIVPTSDGLSLSAVTLRRSDLEALVEAPEASERLLAVTGIADAPATEGAVARNETYFPRLNTSLGPYLRRVLFDPASPIQLSAGLRFGTTYEPTPGLVFSGAVSLPLLGDLDQGDYVTDSQLPPVRTNFPLYNDGEELRLDNLQTAFYTRPGRNLYARVTAGYLERMFGGVSTELLWKPVDSRLGLGAELNYVKQRDFEGLGFQDYDVWTGHLSAYYELPSDFTVQVDAGRYLAGDTGATFTVEREFRNGWRVGAFATFTDVSAEEFGEGSFDKGISFSIPLEWFTGRPTRSRVGTTIRPVTRDGGARLSVRGRLYDRVEDYHRESLEDQWGRVWR